MLICVTNDMPDVESCVVRDLHVSTCNGWGLRLTERGYVETSKPCRGCVPREAVRGSVCSVCFGRLRAALAGVDEWLAAMVGVDRAVKRDSAGVRGPASAPIPISPVQLAVDEVQSYYRHFRGDMDAWVAKIDDAEIAVRFTRAALTAIRSHESAERPHRLAGARCPVCDRVSMQWRPPEFVGDDVTVACMFVDCAGQIDQDAFETIERSPRKRARS